MSPRIRWRALVCSEARANQYASAACYRLAEDVRIVAMMMAELELCEVERQILLADVVIGPDDPTLEKSPEAI